MSKNKIDVTHISRLANLPLSEDEKKELGSQLEDTLSYIQELNEIDTKNTDPTSQVTGLENVTRDDKPTDSLTQDEALANAKEVHNGLFKVKAILSNE